MLEQLLGELAGQATNGLFTFSVVVTDNHGEESARQVAQAYSRSGDVAVSYTVEREKNIAIARNTALSHATGEFVAFIDDDEVPAPEWLLQLFQTCRSRNVAGVLGPVRPHFKHQPPAWVIKGGFYNRRTHPTGFILPWHECRTGNVLFRRSILDSADVPFRPEFGTGGEDQDFFRRMIDKGHQFMWCDEAIAYELVPPWRCSRRFLLSRALLRGKNSLRHRRGRFRNLLKSIVAVPAYSLALPLLLVAGQHWFMRYLVKLADHCGRLLACVGLNPVFERRM